MAELNPKRWFLPDMPDVLGLLRAQLAVTTEGVEAFAGWASGQPKAAVEVREIEARGDVARRELLLALREAFVTPLEPEDLFMLSRGIDRILNGIGNLIVEAEVLQCTPDFGIAAIAKKLVEAVRELDHAIAGLVKSPDEATAAADRSIEVIRSLQGLYYEGMAGTIHLEIRGERIGRREVYRRSARIGETVVDVSERVIYAVVKES